MATEIIFDFAEKLRANYKEMNSTTIVEILGMKGNIKRCPAKVVFAEPAFLGQRELAKAMPNDNIGWDSYTVYVRPIFEGNEDALTLILGHELFHVIAGPLFGEKEADEFAAILLGITKREYRDRLSKYEDLLKEAIIDSQ